MDIPKQVRIVLGTVFVGGLLATLVAGLVWAYTPVGNGGLSFRPDTIPLDTDGAPGEVPGAPVVTGPDDGGDDGGGENGGGDGENGGGGGDGEPAETPTPTPTPTEDEQAEELIAAGADPGATTVQVLEAGGGTGATQAAAEALRGLGYQVINVTSARVDVDRTTVWYTSGNEPEGLALRARDSRFGHVQANQGLNEGTNLHVLVGPDWQG